VAVPDPETQPGIRGVRAIVTTRWKGTAYRPLVMNSLEQYYVDTGMDTDADTWSIDVGDPAGDYLALLERDNEIRTTLYGVGREQHHPILTGIADSASFEDGTWTLTGRDLSLLATDSTVMPHRYSKARAWSIVSKQAHSIGFHSTNLARHGMVKKLIQTDGSESYWDFWYRLYRAEKMWLWTLPNGTLVGGHLNYTAHPLYYLGDARDGDDASIRGRLIPVISASLRKNVQPRVEEVVIYGTRGDTGFSVVQRDPTLSKWIKKPRKVILDSKSRTMQAARKAAWEEIFEGKVGSLEFKVVIPDPGFIVRQNQVARLYLKEIGLYGNYFVVGSRIVGGAEGFQQELRLRERQYAMSKRVPSQPKLNTGSGPRGKGTGTSIGSQIEKNAGVPRGWGDYFVKATKKYHGVMDYSLFLAVLLAMCDTESHFSNVREGGGPEWYPFVAPTGIAHSTGPGTESRTEWQRHWANEKGAPGNPYSTRAAANGEAGVGPMQLTSIGLKQSADDLLNPGHRDQYAGGRWHPEHNIMIAARTLHNNCQYFHAVHDNDIWLAVMAYNLGEVGAKNYFNANHTINPYAQLIKKKVLNDPGYLAEVKTAMQKAKDAAQTKKDGNTSGAGPDDETVVRPSGANAYVVEKYDTVVHYLRNFNRANATAEERRKAIYYAALFAFYHRNDMNYAQIRPMPDMKIFPNVPNPTDCSQFSTWCYKTAGVADPNGLAYNGAGNTTTQWAHGRKVSAAALRPGDLVFFNNPDHVAVYYKNGACISMGSDSGPLVLRISDEAKYHSSIKGYRTYSTA
jgi:prophage tail gpP-like protein